ncbi:agamous-like MADS-box protein AGL61 isoform X2 [Salvia hispanica]|uniref:agamous-like MADS-box protein AGL61 isoform X2 n=1 Tax=Salvia hispanica TaxID=49212 RepID=UPI002009CD04|nr:agamous-like MADS-box protein AGL61 isoform X2 [Salvia hispanica]
MGRRKLEIKRIEDKSSRQVTFSKRRNGLFKKAKELSVLCDLDIGVIIYSCRGKPYHFCSTNSLSEIVQRYHNRAETEAGPSNQVGESQGYLCSEIYLSFVKLPALPSLEVWPSRRLNIQNTHVFSNVKSFFKLWIGSSTSQASMISASQTLYIWRNSLKLHYYRPEQLRQICFWGLYLAFTERRSCWRKRIKCCRRRFVRARRRRR